MPEPIVVVLAGGSGSRIGGAKAGRLLAGRTLLDHAIDLARQWSADPLVAVAQPGSEPYSGVRQIHDREGVAGPLGGIAAALHEALRARARRLMILPVDMPFLPLDLLPTLSAALDKQPGAGCAYASAGGDGYPVCSLWQVELLAAALPGYVASGERSLRGLVGLLGGIAVEWSGPDARTLFFNINTADDLERADQIAERARSA